VERLRQLCRDPTTPLQRIDAAYVETIKPELAARAWELYQQYGRGVIVIDVGTTDLRHMASDDVIHSYYVSEALRRKLGLVCPAALRNALQDDDPQHEMLISSTMISRRAFSASTGSISVSSIRTTRCPTPHPPSRSSVDARIV